MKFRLLALTLLLSLVSATVSPSHEVRAYQVGVVHSLITKLKNNIEADRAQFIAESIHNASTAYKIDPKIIIAIIDTESNFRKGMVSHTGDLSLVQINPMVWNKEFARLKMPLVDAKKLQEDEAYAINLMCEILTLIKVRHGDSDARWFARYHSKTKKYKNLYHTKVDTRIRLMASI